jgi:hypothetical protein
MNARQIIDLRGGRGNGGNNPTPLAPQAAPDVKANHRRSCAMKAGFWRLSVQRQGKLMKQWP